MSAASPFVAVVQTNVNGRQVRAALELADRLPGVGAAFGQVEDLIRQRTGVELTQALPELAGDPIVLAGTAGDGIAVWHTRSATALASALAAGVSGGDLEAAGTYRSASFYSGPAGTAVATSGPLLVAGTSPAAVRAALDRGATGIGSVTATGFDRRAAGVPRSALIRIGASGAGLRTLLTKLYRRAARVPWVAALSRGAMSISAASDGLHAQAVLATTEGELTADDLPLAPGATAPVLHGGRSVTIGVRDLSHLGSFLLAGGEAAGDPLIDSYEDVDKLLGKFAKIDLEQDILGTLTGPATISTDDFEHFDLRAETSDPDGVTDVLRRVAGIGRIGGFFGVDFGGYGITSEDDGLVTLTRDDVPLVTLGVRGDALVASTDPDADFDAIAAGDEQDDGSPPPRGALRAKIAPKVLLDLVVDRFDLPPVARILLEPLGQAIVTARASGGTITAQAFLPVAP